MQTITVKCKLVLDQAQRRAVDATLDAFARATNRAIEAGRMANTASSYNIHHACYYQLRTFLPANLAVTAIRKAAGILNVKKRRRSTVGPSSFDLNARCFSFREFEVSILTTEGRIKWVPLAVGAYQKDLLRSRKPSSAVVFKTRQGDYYIGIHLDVETTPPDLDEDHAWIGVDLGIVEIATTSDGESFSGSDVDCIRNRYLRTRASAQAKGTRGARHLLRRISGRERRFQADINHQISKHIVETARRTGRGIRLEDLSGIRDRVRVRRKQRHRHHRWAFYDLRMKIEYKARIKGVPVELVNPRSTSRTCPVCGHCEKANRKSQAAFVCKACGHSAHADLVGAINISFGGVCQPSRSSAGERLGAAA